MNEIKPIETIYNGYRFRSRLEARWAVFFDDMGIKYEYEHEGFEINGEKYLPDFLLPEINAIVEIKGIDALNISVSDENDGLYFQDGREKAEKYAHIAVGLYQNCTYIILQGDPIDVFASNSVGNGHGDIFFAGTCIGYLISQDQPDFTANCGGETVVCKDCKKQKDFPVHSSFLGFTKTECLIVNDCGDWFPKDYEHFRIVTPSGENQDENAEWLSKNIKAATKARQARFEHGECG